MKYCFLALSWAALVSAMPALAPNSYAIHEKREFTDANWIQRDVDLDRRLVFPMSIGLTQRNLDESHGFLMDVSDPESPNYGKYWSAKKIAEVFSPTKETVDSVKLWLADHGIKDKRVKLSKGSNWLRFNATVGEAESLLRTKYNIFEHVETGKKHLACDEYSIPAILKAHIDFITPTIQFDAVITKTKKHRAIDRRSIDAPQGGIHVVSNVAPTTALFGLTTCSQYTTPDCLRSLYGIPVGTLVSNTSSYGIIEFTPQAYQQSDLDYFYANVATSVPAGTGPIVDLIDGAIVQQTSVSFSANGESDLDLEYAIALVYPQPVTLYQVGDAVGGGSFGTFLDAVDASYCTSGGGDNPAYDPVYPDGRAGGYAGTQDCGTFAATSVISISYAYNEADLSAAYENRQCNEYLKLGLAGVTVLLASGDNGVAGNGHQCCTNPNCAGGTYNSAGAAGFFNPVFPASCPYVTAVGSTQMVAGAALTASEVACQTVIQSGGGFSNVFPAPSYQTAALNKYFSSRHKPNYPGGQYNNASARGYPDISASGANYVTAIDGGLFLVYGTSASSPVVGAVFTLINEQRVKAGKSTIGFVNPTLYANTGMMHDIKSGSNPGCGTAGFQAVSGWDPVTGLGTPNYGKMLKVWMALP